MVVNYYVDQNYTFALATDAVSLSWPWASAGFLVEYQAIGAGDQIGLSSRAEEELVTDGRIAVLEVAVGSGAVGGGVSGLCVNIWIINKFKEKKKSGKIWNSRSSGRPVQSTLKGKSHRPAKALAKSAKTKPSAQSFSVNTKLSHS